MKRLLALRAALLFSLAMAAMAPAQTPADPQLKANPLETLRSFEPAADEEYRLGKGDEISIDFAGRPDLAAKLVVGPDGRITLPLAGDLVLAGQTRQDAAKAIDAALAPYYTNLQAQVTVTRYTANKVLVLGAVEKPGVVMFDGTPTLLEALSRAGLETGPNKAATIPERCAIYRGQNEVVWVELKTLIDSGNALSDLRLRRDDVVYVPNGSERFVSVLGQVQHPGAVALTGTSTLSSILAQAGGFTEPAGNKPHIQIVDPATGTSRVVTMNDLLNPAKSLEITLKPGEIIFVPQSKFFRATYSVGAVEPGHYGSGFDRGGVAMNQLLGRPGGLDAGRYSDNDLASPPAGARPLPGHGPEQAFFHVDFRRSLEQHARLARLIALGGVALAVLYVMAQVFWFKTWPTYEAESTVYVKTTPTKVLENSPGARWPFDNNTYESYIQQQMMNVSREDVLLSAVHKLDGFTSSGESDQAAAQRLVRTLDVTRMGDAYEFTISARSGNPVMAAAIANAVTQAYIESAARDEHSGDAQRAAMLKEEKDRILSALTADHAEQESLNGQLGVASVSSTVPDHYDQDIAEMRSELVKARTDHDAAEAKFAALGAGAGASSSAIDAQADELIGSDAGLVSMKTALNARRATLISQMANLTPANPQYKQDEQELTRINADLEAMMKDLRSKAAARIQLQLRAELQRTGGVESQLNGQLRQLVGSATSATPKLQRSSDLAADITRLQARYATVDEQLHDLILEDSAPGEAYQVTPATPPLTRTKSGVMRNALGIVFAGLGFGLIAAVLAQKLDQKVYIAADVEQVLGFSPLAQLPDFNEVSEGVGEEYVLRLASAVEHGRKQGDLKNLIFTGAASGAGVSTLLNRVRAMLQAMGRPTVLVNASGAQPPAPRPAIAAPKGNAGQGNAGQGKSSLVPALRLSQSTALLREMAGETEEGDDSLVLTDTAPLAVSAETEYLARFVDCAIVVIESGVTTRAQLREAAATLQRLDVGAVGFVLNRVRLATADRGFRQSVEAVEKHVQSVSSVRRQDKSVPFVVESPAVVEMPKAAPPAEKAVSKRSMFEPEVAAAAAAVARFSPAPLAKPVTASAVCMPSGLVSSHADEAAKRFTVSLAAEPAADSANAEPPVVAETDPEQADPGIAPAEASAPTEIPAAPDRLPELANAPQPLHESATAPFLEAARRFASSAPPEAGIPFYPRPVSIADPVAPVQPEMEEPSAAAAAPEAVLPEHEEAILPAAQTNHSLDDSSLPEVEPEAGHPHLAAPKPAIEDKPVLEEQFQAMRVPEAQPEPILPDELPEASLPSPPATPMPAASEEIPWWLSEVVHAPEPVRPQVLWQPARVWQSQGNGANAGSQAYANESGSATPAPEPSWSSFKAAQAAQAPPAAQPPAEAGPAQSQNPERNPEPDPDRDPAQDPASLSSRLSGLRNLLFVLGVQHAAQDDTATAGAEEKAAAKAPAFDQRSGWANAETPSPMYGAAPRVVTAQPEFLPPKSVVIEINKTDAHVGESSTRQDRRAAFDQVDILPSKRGQYKKI